jgi:hypothetical protein
VERGERDEDPSASGQPTETRSGDLSAAGQPIGPVGTPPAHTTLRQCLDAFKLPKFLQDFSSHQIFGCMHGVLNIDKKITNCTIYL